MLYDKDIREPLFDFLEDSFGRVRILEEKMVGNSRADVVMVCEDAVCGIEIKSDADTYVRLKSQVSDYDQYFDCNFVVVGTSHALHIREHVPDYWGVITVEEVEDALDFYVLRPAKMNPHRKWNKKLRIFWRPELAQIQEAFSMPKYKDKGRDFVILKIIEKIENGKIDPDSLQKQMTEILFERDYTQVKELLSEYRNGEIEKQLEKEKDPEKQIALMLRRESAIKNLKPRKKKRRGRYRR